MFTLSMEASSLSWAAGANLDSMFILLVFDSSALVTTGLLGLVGLSAQYKEKVNAH